MPSRDDDWSGLVLSLGPDLPEDLADAVIGTVLVPLNETLTGHGLVMDVRVANDPPAVEIHARGPEPRRRRPDPAAQGAPTSPDPPSVAAVSAGDGGSEAHPWEVQLRFPVSPDTAPLLDDLLDAVGEALDGGDGSVDEVEEEGDEFCCYLDGPDPEELLVAARAAVASVPVGPGAYLVRRHTERLPL